MNILFAIQHPAHVHLFRNSIKILSAEGHSVHVFARSKDINLELLNYYDIEYELLAREPRFSWELPYIQAKYELGIIRAARRLDVDVLLAMGEPAITHAAKLTGAKSLVLTDTEHATVQNTLAFPFADQILTPECYQNDIGPKQIRYPGYQELAYLHPNQFSPDPSVKKKAGLEENEDFVILRLVAWGAIHDIGDSGIDNIEDVVAKIEETGVSVLITSEAPLPKSVEHCRVTIDPHQIHHLIYYADLYLGESSTMAAESAVLGTPAVFVSSIRLGYTNELEDRYGMVFNFSGSDRQLEGLEQAISILEDYDSAMWKQKRKQILNDKIDTTKVILRRVRDLCE